MGSKSRLQKNRLIIQILFIIIVFTIVLLKYLSSKGIPLPFNASGFHSLCPFGAVATSVRYIMQGKFIPETQPSNFWIFLSVIIITVFFGRVFCGWFCPLGSVQEYVYKAGGKFRKNLYTKLPASVKNSQALSRILRILNILLLFSKYFILVFIVIQTTRKVSLLFGKIDPYYALFNFWTGDVLPPALIVLSAVLVLSLFFYRPWCRWFCPLGALLGIVQFMSPFKIRRNSNLCISCGACSIKCPQGISVADKKTVYNTECIKCRQCISCCPVSGALSDCSPQPVSVKNDGNLRGSADSYNNEKAGNHSDLKRITKQGYHFKESVYPALILIIFFIPVIYGKYFSGFYHNEKMTTFHAAENLTEKSGLKAAADSIDIKSSFTIEQLSGHLDISPADLKKYLGMEENAPDDIKLRDIEDFEPELTFKVIKEKISEYIEKI